MAGFDSYVLMEQVGQGGTGTVHRARQMELDRVVAVKQLAPALRGAPGLLERFRAEAQMLARLDDPHVVALYDFLEDGERAWIVEQWVDGVSLEAVLTDHGRLSPEQAVGVVRGGLLGLAHAHDREILHGDLSPGNILLDEQGTSRLVDFGLAAPVGSAGLRGTPAFLSPEAAAGAALGKPSDVYSAAAVLFLLLAGRPPFPAPDLDSVLRAHRQEPAPTLPDSGPRLAGLLARAMDKDPDRRPADARALLAELEDAAEERFGAGWLGRSSVAGLVAATIAARGAGIGGSASQAAQSKQTVQITTSGVDTGAATAGAGAAAAPQTAPAADPAAPGPRRRGRPRLPAPALALAAVAVILLAGVGVATVLASNDDPQGDAKQEGAGAAPSSAAPSPSPTAPPLAATAPVGRYAVVSQIVQSTNETEPVGTVFRGDWTITLDCTSTPCKGTIASSGGRVYTATFDGATLAFTSTSSNTEACVNDDGQPVEGKMFTTESTLRGTVSAVAPAGAEATADPADVGPPPAMAGTSSGTTRILDITPGCTRADDTTQLRKLTLTRKD